MKYHITCSECGVSFESSQSHTKACGRLCKTKRNNRLSGRIANPQGMNTGTMGALTEMEIAVDLFKKGYDVFRALSQSCFCDLLAHKNGKMLRIECRTAYMSVNRKLTFNNKAHGDIDIFAVYVPSEDAVFYLENDGKKETTLA